MKLFNFEFKRFVSSKRNKYLLAIISLLIVGYGAYQTLYEVNTLKNTIQIQLKQGAKFNKNSASSAISKMKALLKSSKSEEERNSLTSSLTSFQEDLEIYKKQIIAINTNKINEYYSLQAQLDNITLNRNAGQSQQAYIIQADNWANQELSYIRAVQKRRLNFEGTATTQMHSFGNFQQQFLPLLFSSLFIVLFASMVSITIASGLEKAENRTYYFMGISRSEDLFSKVFAGTLVTYGWILLASLVYFMVIGFVNGFGAWNYPAYLSNNIVIANGIVDGISLLYFLLIIIFLASLGALISALAKKSLVVVAVIAILVIGYSMIENVKWMKPLQRFIPMSYFNPSNLLNNPSSLFGKSSLIIGVIYLLGLSVIFLELANLVFKNYKIRRLDDIKN